MKNYLLAILCAALLYSCGFSISTTDSADEGQKTDKDILKVAIDNFCGQPKSARSPFVPDNDPCGDASVEYFSFHKSADTIPQIKNNYRRYMDQLNDSLTTQYIEVSLDTIDFVPHYRVGSFGKIDSEGDATGYNSFSFVGGNVCQANGYIPSGDTLLQIRTDEPGGQHSISVNVQKIEAQYLIDIKWDWYIITHECGHGNGCRCHGQDDFEEWFNDNCVSPSYCNGYKLDTLEKSGMTYPFADTCTNHNHLANSFFPEPTAFDWRINFEQNGKRSNEPENVIAWQAIINNYIDAKFNQEFYPIELHLESNDIDTLIASTLMRILTKESYRNKKYGEIYAISKEALPIDVTAIYDFIENYNKTLSFSESIEMLAPDEERTFKHYFKKAEIADTAKIDTVETEVVDTVIIQNNKCTDCKAMNHNKEGNCNYSGCRPKYSTTYLPSMVGEWYKAIDEGKDTLVVGYQLRDHPVYPDGLAVKGDRYFDGIQKALDTYTAYYQCIWGLTLIFEITEIQEDLKILITCSRDLANTQTMVASPGGCTSWGANYAQMTIPVNETFKYFPIDVGVAHEMGHIIGSDHDKSSCDGSYVMKPVLTREKILDGHIDYYLYSIIVENMQRYKDGNVQTCNDLPYSIICNPFK